MNWFNILEGSHRSASGLEWFVWRKLPIIALVGTLLPAMVWAVLNLVLISQTGAEQSGLLLTVGYVAIGAVIFHWMMVLTLAIGCAIVIVMKGPGYVADAYPLSHSDQPLGNRSEAPDTTVDVKLTRHTQNR